MVTRVCLYGKHIAVYVKLQALFTEVFLGS